MSRRSFGLAVTVVLLALWAAHSQSAAVRAQGSNDNDRRPLVLDRAPVRAIQDPLPSFNGIALDADRREVFIADDNRANILVYDAEFPPTNKVVEPRRQIAGPGTHLGYICTLAVSPQDNEIFTVDNDWKDNMTVYPLTGNGELAPRRELNVNHGTWGIFLDQKHNELLLTVEHTNQIVVYRKTADEDEDPLRNIQGPQTGLADPHGIFVDTGSNELFVTNHGNWRKTEPGEGGTLFFGKRTRVRTVGVRQLNPSTGRFLPPSITVFSREARGDVKPLRTIQGPHTLLNLPLGIYLDPAGGQLVVANAGDSSILFFDKNASGDAPPVRVIKGPATGIDGPSGVVVDSKRNELWVTNWNNHTATIYARNATGNAKPLRTLRSAPRGTPITGFGNPGGVVYDAKRKELLVPN
jgi:DNA-binding beta-propeller fold protein YncE